MKAINRYYFWNLAKINRLSSSPLHFRRQKLRLDKLILLYLIVVKMATFDGTTVILSV